LRIHHVALVCGSEENADRFYRDLLGFEQTRSFMVPGDLARGLFGYEGNIQTLTYLKDDTCFEVFVVDEAHPATPLCHVALAVENKSGFLKRCERFQIRIVEVSKGEKTVTMIQDFDGNLFEIKEAA
jgi:catechol 2,3-dioxygenase-like lactoylglutathione lyase family enzyme